jgi:hypothetical protein
MPYPLGWIFGLLFVTFLIEMIFMRPPKDKKTRKEKKPLV